jgi:carbamoyl-phosphate synthase large subunit
MNILITSVNNKVLLVKQFKKAASNYPDVSVFSGDITSDIAGALFSDKHIILPKDNDPLFFDKIKTICVKNNIKLIINTRDEELKLFSTYKKQFQNIGCLLMLASTETLDICQNKAKFFKFCEKNHIDVPKTYWESKDIKYPAFAKPIYGKASRGTFKINSKTDIPDVSTNIIQEYIDWPEYTVDLFTDFEGNVISVVPRKRIKVIGGESHVSETENNSIIINKSIDLCQKLNLVGHNVIQCFYKKGQIKFIEVNPRFGGASNLSFKSGANSPKFLIDLLKNKPITPQIGKFTNKLKMYRHNTDVFINNSIQNKIFCIDVDGTLCTEGTEYEKAQPIHKVIDKINHLYEDNTIILYTARGASSGYNWKPLTEKQLNQWGVKYHNLIMGKPYADYYIDNKAIDILEWI